MATLTADKSRQFDVSKDMRNNLPMAGSISLYMGEAVGLSGGLIVTATASTTFEGFMAAGASSVGEVDGAVKAEIRVEGEVILSVAGTSAVTDNGNEVFLSDGNTFDLVTTNAYVGNIVEWITGTTCRVAFKGQQRRFYVAAPA